MIRYLSLLWLDKILIDLGTSTLQEAVLAAVEGLSLTHWVTLLLIASMGLFGYQVVVHWTASLRSSTDALKKLNSQLTEEIQERRRIEAQLQEKTAQLEGANKSKDRFLSIISHDLRSPMSSILGVAQTLSKDFDDLDRELLREFLHLLNNSAEHLYELLENLLAWARLQTDGPQYKPEQFDLEPLAQNLIELLNHNASSKNIHLHTNVAPETRVWADPNMIRSVLLNLLSNAIKFTQPGGAVVLTVQFIGGRLGIEVRDTGVGMTETQLSRLFRIDTAFSTQGTADENGSGLGLILCKEMVDQHGTHLQVASQPGVGTMFSFSLPVNAVPSVWSKDRMNSVAV